MSPNEMSPHDMGPHDMGPNDMEHFLLTRFNVRLADRPAATDQWLRDRLRLFTTFTVPSVHAQTCTDFRWLALCDEASPDWLREELAQVAMLEPVWVREAWTPGLPAAVVHEQRAGADGLVVTSRLDNDDAIARTYIARVQAAATEEGFVNFTSGAQWAHGRLYRRLDPSNPFISRVETGPRAATVFAADHNKLAALGPIRQFGGGPMWLQVVHDGNLENRTNGIRMSPTELTQRFTIAAAPKGVSRLGLAVAQAGTTARMAARMLARPRRLLLLAQTRRNRVRPTSPRVHSPDPP